MTDTSEYIGYANSIIESLSAYKEHDSRHFIDNIARHAKQFKKDVEAASEENRLLKIGIIGQIKRGKSTFLNALLFDGESILPKAASPMTAALTSIVYGPELKFTVDFYGKEEWEQFKATGMKGLETQKIIDEINNGLRFETPPSLSDDEIACGELLKSVQTHPEILDECIGQPPRTLEGFTNFDELKEKMKEYVGADGKYTPLVSMSEITLNLDSLKGISILDTPGLNDPIISRSELTKDRLGQCDVVFLMSQSGQFLDQSDIQLLSQELPERGIKRKVLVGAKFDSAILDENNKKQLPFDQVFSMLKAKLDAQISQRVNDPATDAKVSTALKEAVRNGHAIYVSPLCFSMARHFGKWNPEENHLATRLQKKFPDLSLDEKKLLEIANLEPIRKILEQVRLVDKEKILNERVSEITEAFIPACQRELEEFKGEMQTELDALVNGTTQQLKKEKETAIKQLKKGESIVSNIFSKHAVKVEKEMALLKADLNLGSQEAMTVKTQTKSETKEYTDTIDHGRGFLFWRSITGNRYEEVTRTKTVTYAYANVHDAISKLETFANDARIEISKKITDIIDIEQLKQDVSSSVKLFVDTGADDFNPQVVLDSIDIEVGRLTIPDIMFDSEAAVKLIRSKFNTSDVRDSGVDQLRETQREAVKQVMKNMIAEMTTFVTNTSKNLQDIGKSFLYTISQDLNNQIQKITEKEKEKEKSIKTYNQIISAIDELI